MSGGQACRCEESKKPVSERGWVVNTRHGNYSAFNGGRFQRSNYSSVSCMRCSATWRTTAQFVYHLKDRYTVTGEQSL